MADKHTKRELFETLLVFAAAAEAEGWVIDGLEHEIELLNRKRSSQGVDSKRLAEVAKNKGLIRDALVMAGEPVRATAIAKTASEMSGTTVSVQRVSALLKQMVESGEVTRTEGEKKITYFSL